MAKISYDIGITFQPEQFHSVRVAVGVSDLDPASPEFEADVERARGALQFVGRQMEETLADEASTASGMVVESAVSVKDFSAYRENNNKVVNKLIATIKELKGGTPVATEQPPTPTAEPAPERDTADAGASAPPNKAPASSTRKRSG
jgi:hypothetical protein